MPIFVLTCFFAISTHCSGTEIEDLIQKSKSKKSDDRISAIIELGQLLPKLDGAQEKRVAEVLIATTADPVEMVRVATRMQLAQHPATANKYLGPYLESEERLQYARACEAIKAIGPISKNWLPELEKKLGHQQKAFELSALHALRALDGDDLLPVLDKVIKALDSKDFNIQLSACRVISKIGPQAKKAGPRLVILLEEGIVSARSWAAIALGAIGPHDDYDVVKLLAKRLDMFYVIDRQRALQGLAMLGPDAKPALPKVKELMQLRSKSVQHTAARTYWKITGDAPVAVDKLIQLLPTMEFGSDSMDILGEIGVEAKTAVPALIKQLKSTEAPSRESAIYALASIGPAAANAIAPLKLMKKDKDQVIRAAARMAIAAIRTSEHVE